MSTCNSINNNKSLYRSDYIIIVNDCILNDIHRQQLLVSIKKERK